MQIKVHENEYGEILKECNLQVSYHAGYQLNLVKECTVRSVHSTAQSNSMKAWVCVDNIKKNPAPSIPVSLS
jgi:hypothetical protein